MSLSSRLTALLQTGVEVAFSRNFLTIDISSDIGSIDLGREICNSVVDGLGSQGSDFYAGGWDVFRFFLGRL